MGQVDVIPKAALTAKVLEVKDEIDQHTVDKEGQLDQHTADKLADIAGAVDAALDPQEQTSIPGVAVTERTRVKTDGAKIRSSAPGTTLYDGTVLASGGLAQVGAAERQSVEGAAAAVRQEVADNAQAASEGAAGATVAATDAEATRVGGAHSTAGQIDPTESVEGLAQAISFRVLSSDRPDAALTVEDGEGRGVVVVDRDGAVPAERAPWRVRSEAEHRPDVGLAVEDGEGRGVDLLDGEGALFPDRLPASVVQTGPDGLVSSDVLPPSDDTAPVSTRYPVAAPASTVALAPEIEGREPSHGWAWQPLAAQITAARLTAPDGVDVLVRSATPEPPGQYYQGTFDASAGDYPAPGSTYDFRRGYWWRCSAAGTVDGVAYAVGDRLVYVACRRNSTNSYSGSPKDDFVWRRYAAGHAGPFVLGALTAASPTPDAGAAPGDAYEVGEAGAYAGVPCVAGDRLTLADDGVSAAPVWALTPTPPVTTVAGGAVVALGEGPHEARRADGGAAGALAALAGTLLRPRTAAVRGGRVVVLDDAGADALAEAHQAGDASAAPMWLSPTRLSFLRRRDGASARVVFDLDARTVRPETAGRDVVYVGDSIAAHYANPFNLPELTDRDAAAGRDARAVVDLGYGSMDEVQILETLRRVTESGDVAADAVVVLCLDFGYDDVPGQRSALLRSVEALDARPGARWLVTWQSVRRDVGQVVTASGYTPGGQRADDCARLSEDLYRAFGARYLDYFDVVRAAPELVGLYDPSVPTAADQREVVRATGGLPWLHSKPSVLGSVHRVPGTDPEQLRGHFQGYWTSQSAPTGGVAHDYYVVVTGGDGVTASGYTTQLGGLWYRTTAGDWIPYTQDPLHPGLDPDAYLGGRIMVRAIADRIDAFGWAD